MADRVRALKQPNVTVVHYGALQGRNDLRQFRAVYLTHLFQPPTGVMLAMAAAAGRRFERVEYQRRNAAGGFRGFYGLEMEMNRIQLIVTTLIQDVYRTAIRDGGDVDVFVGLAHLGIINCLHTFYGDRIEWIKEEFKKLDNAAR